jgi:hypothetical protein
MARGPQFSEQVTTDAFEGWAQDDLVLGYYSVHASAAALQAGEARIECIGRQLAKAGRLRR